MLGNADFNVTNVKNITNATNNIKACALANKANKKIARKKGGAAETRACNWLEKQGFEIVERNFFARVGEIDIVAKRGEEIHFIEVKSGKGLAPHFAITPKKLSKIYASIEVFLFKNNIDSPYCVDALFIGNGADGGIEFIENVSL